MNYEAEKLFDAIAGWKSNDDWQFADKEAAWKFFFQAGAASRDAEVARLKTVPMRYRRMAFNAQLQDENAKLREQVAMLRDEVTRCRDWFETQAKVNSKGGPSSWELMLLRDERDAAEEALAATELQQ